MASLIEAEGVHVRFGDRVVLEAIDLEVAEGELHGIMGPNGAGKTTFFNVLTGRREAEPRSHPPRRRGPDRPRAAPDRPQGGRAIVSDHEPLRRFHAHATT